MPFLEEKSNVRGSCIAFVLYVKRYFHSFKIIRQTIEVDMASFTDPLNNSLSPLT